VLIDEPPVARLTDFGTSFSNGNTSGLTKTAQMSKQRVSEAYQAPELSLWDDQDPEAGIPTVKADIYSFSLLVWHVCLLIGFHRRPLD
jgi:serine/threonine protein kinase